MIKNFLKTKLLFFLLFFPFKNLFASSPHQIFIGDLSGIEFFYFAVLGLINWLFAFLTLGSLIGIIIGAYLIIFSGGDGGKLENGKKAILYSLAALLIASFAWAIITWAQDGFAF